MMKEKFISIGTKLFLAITVSVSAILIPTSIAIFYSVLHEKKVDTLDSLALSTKIMAQNLVAAVDFEDKRGAKTTLQTLHLNPSIDGAILLDKKGDLFASYIAQGIYVKELQALLKKLNKKNLTTEIKHIDDRHIITSSVLYSSDGHLATLAIISNTHSLEAFKEKLLITLALVFSVTLIIVLIIATKIKNMVLHPLFTMKNAIQNVKQNKNYNLHISTQNNDEFKILFDGFNSMLSTIKLQDREQLKLIDELQNAKSQIEQIHKNTQDSIEYAALIQNIFIPHEDDIQKHFQDHFVIWEPKDLVGGDIYLFEELREGESLLMVIDCTGHGVPGAFVTMLVKAIERQIVTQLKNSPNLEVSPANILAIFNKTMKHLLKQEDKNSLFNAGFDGQILYFNREKKIMKCASARNEIYYFEQDQLKIIKGDRYSVGYKDSDVEYQFSEHMVSLETGSCVYVSSDGYWDQNGGEKGFPLGKKKFKALLERIHRKSMEEQKQILIDQLRKYQQECDRNDDITVVGLKV